MELQKLEYISNNPIANKIKVILYTNFDMYEPKLLELLSKFKDYEILVNISTEFFSPRIIWNNPKIQTIMKLRKFLGSKLTTTVVIDTYHSKCLGKYVKKYLKNCELMKELGISFSLEFPKEKDYEILDFYNLFVFYDTFQEYAMFTSSYAPYRFILEILDYPREICDITSGDELTLDTTGDIVPCRRFTNHRYSEEEIKAIEDDSKICEKCKFNTICEPCKYSYYGINHRELKCKRILNSIKALQLMEISGNSKFVIPEQYILNIYLGNRCNKTCEFCYNHIRYPEQQEFKLDNLKKFLQNNFWELEEIDSLVGGEPSLYISPEFSELSNFVEKIPVFSNCYEYNKELATNRLYSITLSIHDSNLYKILYQEYENNIVDIQVMLSQDVIDNIYTIIEKLIIWGKPFVFSEIYAFDDRVKPLPISSLEVLFSALKFYGISYEDCMRKPKKFCDVIHNKLGYDMDKITICRSIYESRKFDKNLVVSYSPETYKFNIEDTKNILKCDNNICPANCGYTFNRGYVYEYLKKRSEDEKNRSNNLDAN